MPFQRLVIGLLIGALGLPILLCVVFAGQLSRLILGYHDPLLIDCAIVGLWSFTNLEMAYAQLRVDERARAYVYASGANVALTVGLPAPAGSPPIARGNTFTPFTNVSRSGG